MNIKIKCDEDVLELTNEGFTNTNYVCLMYQGKEFDMYIDELYQAVSTFKRIKDEDTRRISED